MHIDWCLVFVSAVLFSLIALYVGIIISGLSEQTNNRNNEQV